MTRTIDTRDDLQDSSIPTEPMRCAFCGNLIGYYSKRSEADFLFRCWKCSNDYDVTLKEGASHYKRRSSRSTLFPKGH